MTANQSVPDLNKILSSNFWWLRNLNHVKFTEECVMYKQNHVLVKKKMFTYGLKICLP